MKTIVGNVINGSHMFGSLFNWINLTKSNRLKFAMRILLSLKYLYPIVLKAILKYVLWRVCVHVTMDNSSIKFNLIQNFNSYILSYWIHICRYFCQYSRVCHRQSLVIRVMEKEIFHSNQNIFLNFVEINHGNISK